ncbi:MAG: methyltransferase domain-containing protein, partial [Promethearchaeota archaeon]
MKLNIGCGKKFEADYCNIDLYEDLIADKKMSALNLEFDDNSCQEIKAIHLIEHLGFYQSIYALSEFFRVLEPKGHLIIETPDLEKAFDIFLKSDYEEKKDALNWIYGLPHEGLEHKFCFPAQLLLEILEKIGFEKVNLTNFWNNESIPTIKIVCHKPEINEFIEIFQIFSSIRKKMVIDEVINFKNLFLTKEQEDCLNFLLIKTINFIKNDNKEKYFKFIKKLLINFPKIVRYFTFYTKNLEIFSDFERIQISEITEFLIKCQFHKILLDALMKAPLIPGSQKIIFSSIESFGLGMIDKLFSSKSEKDEMINKITQLFQNIKNFDTHLFSSNLIRRKSLDIFYQGIKCFFNKDYKNALDKFLTAIKLYRDNFLYFWNLSKVLVSLNLRDKAIRYYRKTLKLLSLTTLQHKSQIKKDLRLEIESVK